MYICILYIYIYILSNEVMTWSCCQLLLSRSVAASNPPETTS